jgi:hypothetical protein
VFAPFGIARRKDKEPPRSVIFRSVKGVLYNLYWWLSLPFVWCYSTSHFRLESHNNNLYKILGHTFFFYYTSTDRGMSARESSVCGSLRRYTHKSDGGRVQMGRRRMESWHCPRWSPSLKWHQVAGEIDAAAANALLLYVYISYSLFYFVE